MKTTISACFLDFRPLRGRITRFPDVSPARPDLFDAVWRVFRTETQLFSTAFLAFWAARVISGPPATFQTKRSAELHVFHFFFKIPGKCRFRPPATSEPMAGPSWHSGDLGSQIRGCPRKEAPPQYPKNPKPYPWRGRSPKKLFIFILCEA